VKTTGNKATDVWKFWQERFHFHEQYFKHKWMR